MRHRFCHELSVRYADTDMQGHVFFANYFTFFDEAMSAYLHAAGCSPAQLAELGADFVYADARCSYQGSAHWGERLQIHTTVSRLGNTSATWELAIYTDAQAPEPIAGGQLVTVMVDAKTLRPIPLLDAFRTAVEAYEAKPV